jgi:2-oxoisovalerate dehydrogenase E1 component
MKKKTALKKVAKKSTAPQKKLNPLLSAYREMLRARLIDEKAITLYKQNKCHFQIGCAGHEAVQVATANAMNSGSDWFYPYYRDMGLVCALGMSTKELLLNILSKADDPNSGGRQMPMHYGHKDLRIVSQSSPTGTQYLQAVGAAMGAKYGKTKEVVYVSSGEGTTAQGAYHEALNWAAREKLPIIFVIQDNKFAISVHISEHIAGGSIEKISTGYEGLNVETINGLDYEKSQKAMKKAVDRARKGNGPTLFIADVVRLQSHSISDNQMKYRKAKEVEAEKKKDPILLLEKKLIAKKIASKKDLTKIREDLILEVNEATIWAEEQLDPSPESSLDFILHDQYPSPIEESYANGSEEFMVDAINKALHEEMKRDDKMFVYGQDVGYGKGGVFSVTTGLTDKFGESRCFNSPLAEDSICGTAVGLATVGYKPVVEIQFGDYIWTGMMQIRNELATMYYRSNGNFTCPAVLRVAVGGYIRGALYHSQNIEATFAHYPGLVVIYPSNATDAKGLLKTAIRGNDPVLFLEHKGLYRQVFAKGKIGDEDSLIPIGKAKVVKVGTHATIVTWGALVHRSVVVAEDIKEELGLDIEVIDLRTIAPLDKETIINSVKKTSRLLIAHEDVGFVGFGAEISAIIAEEAFNYLDAPIKRVTSKFSMIGQAPSLENDVLPNRAKIKAALLELLEY